jgi:hypothetical protein
LAEERERVLIYMLVLETPQRNNGTPRLATIPEQIHGHESLPAQTGVYEAFKNKLRISKQLPLRRGLLRIFQLSSL